MNIIEELPVTQEAIDVIPFQDLVALVCKVTDPETRFGGDGLPYMQISTFLAYASIRMAKAIAHAPAAGLLNELIALDGDVRHPTVLPDA